MAPRPFHQNAGRVDEPQPVLRAHRERAVEQRRGRERECSRSKYDDADQPPEATRAFSDPRPTERPVCVNA